MLRAGIFAVVLFGSSTALSAASLFAYSAPVIFTVPYHTTYSWAFPVTVSTDAGRDVGYRVSSITPGVLDVGDFLVISPRQGTAPSTMWVGLNNAIVPTLNGGSYVLTITLASTDPTVTGTAKLIVLLQIVLPSPRVYTVANDASPNSPLSPGTLVQISGVDLGPQRGTQVPGPDGLYSATDDGDYLVVQFGGIPAPLLKIGVSSIQAVVPWEAPINTPIDVVVNYVNQKSPAYSITLTDTSPAIYTADQTGTGAAFVYNGATKDPTNRLSNGAPPGSEIAFYATGGGPLVNPVLDGTFNFAGVGYPFTYPYGPAFPYLKSAYSLTIGGLPAQIVYAGPVALTVTGTLQFNAIVPPGAQSGAQPMVLTIGNNNNAAQAVTVWVK